MQAIAIRKRFALGYSENAISLGSNKLYRVPTIRKRIDSLHPHFLLTIKEYRGIFICEKAQKTRNKKQRVALPPMRLKDLQKWYRHFHESH